LIVRFTVTVDLLRLFCTHTELLFNLRKQRIGVAW